MVKKKFLIRFISYGELVVEGSSEDDVEKRLDKSQIVYNETKPWQLDSVEEIDENE
jgi:hypothetical protein